jgi:hypothetical protein
LSKAIALLIVFCTIFGFWTTIIGYFGISHTDISNKIRPVALTDILAHRIVWMSNWLKLGTFMGYKVECHIDLNTDCFISKKVQWWICMTIYIVLYVMDIGAILFNMKLLR